LKPVRAFVGHSFTPDDAVLVAPFLKYLTAISEMHPSFSWEHAERAEPMVIDEKVLRLFADKTLFIAICTRKERVISPDALGQSFFLPNRFIAVQAAFAWKTSDWIIQEIGLAIGLGLPVILLVEDGVRSPGGLQGNLECIAFSRSSPERSFPKLAEMIATLSPRSKALQESTEAPAVAASQGRLETEAPLPENAWANPSPTWSRRQFDFAFISFVAIADEVNAKRISDAFLASDIGGDAESRQTWVADCEWARIALDKGGKLQRLVTLAAEHPANSGVGETLGRGFLHYGEYSKSADAFEQAAVNATDARHVIRLLKESALAAQKGGDGARALKMTDRMRQLAQEAATGYESILEAERMLAELRKEDDVQIATLERLLEISPDDAEKRFALAYKYSELERNDLAALHYSRIPLGERTGVTWNNFAVSLDRLGMPGKAVTSYRRAEELGETLAMSNLANKLTEFGFLCEARAILEAAIAVKDHHKNVDSSLNRLKDLPEDESRKEAEVIEQAKPISDFYRAFGEALMRPLPAVLADTWRGPDCPLEFNVEDGRLVARGQYERAQGGLLLAMMSHEGFAGKTDAAPLRFRVEYVATARGSALVGQVKRFREGEVLKGAAATFLAQEEAPQILMVVSADGRLIRVLERSKNTSQRTYEFKAA
jgi:tetratricopeptide (TPR) repeat protein